jgi:hypothetical protein
MNAELMIFGCRMSMAQQRRRRVLLVSMYACFAALMAVLWYLTHWRGTGSYVIWAAILACRYFLGGYYTGGLIKPFNGKAPQRQWEMPSPLLALKLRVYLPVLAADSEAAYRNDERELHQRDRAHYLAYQALGVVTCVPMLLASLHIVRASLLGWIPIAADELYYGLTLVAVVLFLTLPQSILLWTEPDMEKERQ